MTKYQIFLSTDESLSEPSLVRVIVGTIVRTTEGCVDVEEFVGTGSRSGWDLEFLLGQATHWRDPLCHHYVGWCKKNYLDGRCLNWLREDLHRDIVLKWGRLDVKSLSERTGSWSVLGVGGYGVHCPSGYRLGCLGRGEGELVLQSPSWYPGLFTVFLQK